MKGVVTERPVDVVCAIYRIIIGIILGIFIDIIIGIIIVTYHYSYYVRSTIGIPRF